MKIITMCKIVEDGERLENYDDPDHKDWFCVIETKEEELVYDKFNGLRNFEYLHAYQTLWNEMVNHAGLGMGVSWGDDDIYAYIRPDETEPEVGEHYKLDEDEWVRVE